MTNQNCGILTKILYALTLAVCMVSTTSTPCLAQTAEQDGVRLRINGTNGDDHLAVRSTGGAINVDLDGDGVFEENFSGISYIYVYGLEDQDEINIVAPISCSALVVNPGLGRDFVTFSGGDEFLGNYQVQSYTSSAAGENVNVIDIIDVDFGWGFVADLYGESEISIIDVDSGSITLRFHEGQSGRCDAHTFIRDSTLDSMKIQAGDSVDLCLECENARTESTNRDNEIDGLGTHLSSTGAGNIDLSFVDCDFTGGWKIEGGRSTDLVCERTFMQFAEIVTGPRNDHLQFLDNTLMRHLNIDTGAGSDLVEFKNGTTIVEEVNIATGPGNDAVVTNFSFYPQPIPVTFGGEARIDTGTSDRGNDVIMAWWMDVNRMEVRMGSGEDVFNGRYIIAHNDIGVDMGRDSDETWILLSEFRSELSLLGGSGIDTLWGVSNMFWREPRVESYEDGYTDF